MARKKSSDKICITFFKKIQSNAIKRGLNFNLSIDYLWDLFLKNVAEKEIIRLYKRNEVLLTLTPEERYLKLLDVHPQIMQRVSQRKIATFIGITEQSLSRIRKRIFTKPPNLP